MRENINQSYDFFLHENMDAYENRWVAIIENKVVAAADDLKSLMDKVKKMHPGKEPLVAKVPSKKMEII
jgi:hypothetical protein